MPLTKNSSRSMQRQIDLTTAVCQERLLATHTRHVLGLVDLVSDRVPFDDALDIYVRLLRLTPEQARNVGSRALAELGRRSGVPDEAVSSAEISVQHPPPRDEAADDEVESDAEKGRAGGRADAVMGRLRKRIRGRVQEDLRHRINLAVARTEDAIFHTHVDDALTFVKALADDLNASEAVELYVETMMLPEGFADVIYNRALRIIADEVLPALESERRTRAVAPEGSDQTIAAAG